MFCVLEAGICGDAVTQFVPCGRGAGTRQPSRCISSTGARHGPAWLGLLCPALREDKGKLARLLGGGAAALSRSVRLGGSCLFSPACPVLVKSATHLSPLISESQHGAVCRTYFWQDINTEKAVL